MPTEKANVNKNINKANQAALKGFPKAKIKKAFETMSGSAQDAEASNDTRQAAALTVVDLAERFVAANQDATTETLVIGWRDNMKVLAMTLAIEGNRFATMTEAKDDKPATAKLTGYGNNVASIAKGAIEFDCGPSALAGTDEVDGDVSYRDVRKAVESRRAEARRKADPDAAALEDAKALADEAWKDLRTLIFDTGRLSAIESLAETLIGHHTDVSAQLIADSDDAPETDDVAEAA